MQNNKVDGDAILRNINIIDVIERHGVQLKKKGVEYYGNCPFHDDATDSLQVNERKQIFKCFACDVPGGDAIAFLMALGLNFHEAVKELTAGDFKELTPEKREALHKKRPQWKQIRPVPADVPAPKFIHYLHGAPALVWKYRDEAGALVGYVCRFNLEDGGKEVVPLVYATDGNRAEWRWQGFSEPRPIYNLFDLASRPDATVIVTEGEKAADAAAEFIPKAVAVTWIGGSKALAKTDFSPLKGRRVLFWPDNDVPGLDAMFHLNELLRDELERAELVQNPADAPKGWDVADADFRTNIEARNYILENRAEFPPPHELNFGLDWIAKNGQPVKVWNFGDRVFGWIKDQRGAVEWKYLKAPEKQTETPPETTNIPPPAEYIPTDDGSFNDAENDSEVPFTFLGFDKDETGSQKFYFYVSGSRTTISLSASKMSKPNLITLAPLQFWEMEFATKQGFDIAAAQNWLINRSNAVGIFKDKYIRGRGAWIDAGRVVLHAGNALIVDGKRRELGSLKSRFIYEQAEELPFATENPVSATEANKLVDILKLLNWDREINAYLLAGWIVVAPVCGALNWRPHIWLTGAAGTGKSWLFQNVVRRILGETALSVQSETTEAGIRQILQHDAIPVVFDEAEGEDARAAERMERILSLMRAASADDGGIMAKGSAGGTAKTFRIRSCFAFASIAVQVKHQSDRGRVTILGIKKNPDKADRERRWKECQKLYSETITADFISGLQARTTSVLPSILENAKTFAAAAAAELGEQRIGDQLGALLAGAYSLFSNKIITFDAATKWLKEKDWTEERALDGMRDEVALISHLFEQMTSVEGVATKFERSVGELVQIAAGVKIDDPIVTAEASEQKLKRIGFKIDGDAVLISNSADWIKNALRGTAWAKNHNKILLRLEGALPVESTFFASGVRTRAVRVPLKVTSD